MADRDSERDKRVRELLSDKSSRKNQMGVLGQANAEVQDIQSELQNHLAMQQMQDQARLKQTQTIAQAAQGMMAADGGGDVQGQVAAMNPQTQATMGKYGIKPQRTQNTTRNGSNQRTVSKSGDITNIKNESITNNRTEIRVTQPTIPISQPQIPVRAQGQGNQANNNAKFKAWLDGMFAKQQQEAEIQKKEYRRKEWNLGRTTNKLMKRIESSASSLGDKLNPANMSTTLFGQLKWLLMIFGATMIGKVWKPAMQTIANIDAGIRSAFGLPISGDLQKGGAKGISIVDKIKGFIGIEKGENISLIGGIGRIFSEGIDKLIAKIELWMEDRSIAIKQIKFPKIEPPKSSSFADRAIGNLLSPLIGGVTNAFKGVAQYLGDVMTAAWGGSKGAAKVESNAIAKQSKETFYDKTGKSAAPGEQSLLNGGAGRDYMRKTDFNLFGNLKNEAASSHAMSRTVMSLFDDRSNKSHAAEIGTGVGHLFSNAKTYGQVVIDPRVLQYLGLTGHDINDLKGQGMLTQKDYRIIAVKANTPEEREEMEAYTGHMAQDLLSGAADIGAFAKEGKKGYRVLKALSKFGKGARLASKAFGPGALIKDAAIWGFQKTMGNSIGALIDTWISDITSKGYYPKLVPADSPQMGDDGSPGVPKTMWVLSKGGADEVAKRYLDNKDASASDMALNNRKFFEKIQNQEKTRKTQNGVSGSLTENISTNNLQTQFSRQALYEENLKALDEDPKYEHVNKVTKKAQDIWDNTGTYVANALDAGARWLHSDGGGKVDKDEKQRRVNHSMKFFIDRGFTKEQAAGIVGNLSKEGLFQKDLGYAHSDGVGENEGDSAGIAQFHDIRGSGGELSNLKKFAKQRNLDWTDLDTQLLYLVEGSPRAKKALKKISEITETGDEAIDKASFIFGDEYEVFKGHADYNNSRHAERRDVAKTYYTGYDPENTNITNYQTGSGELNLIQKSGNFLAEQLHAMADRFRGGGKSDDSESTSISGPVLSEKQKQIVAEYNKWKQSSARANQRNLERLGARTDSSGTYFEMGGYRGYINPNSTGGLFGISEADITHISKVDETGNLKVLDSSDHEEINTAKNSLIARVATFNTNYEGKGNGSKDYMLDGNGKALMFPLGTFTDIDSFQTDYAKKDFAGWGGGFKLYVFPSKDRSRETMICISSPKADKPQRLPAKSIMASEYRYHGFDDKLKKWYYGDEGHSAIYWRGKKFIKWGCLETDKNATTDWYPVWDHYCRKESLTPAGMKALAEFFEILNLGKIEGRTDRAGKFTANGKELSKDQIEKAKKFGILTEHVGGRHEGEGVYYNKEHYNYFRMSDDLEGAQDLAEKIKKEGMTSGITNYLKDLGLSDKSSSKDIEKYFNEHREQFQVVNGKVVDASGIQWGTFENGKFSFSDGKTLIGGTSEDSMGENKKEIERLMALKIGNIYGIGDLNSGLDFLRDKDSLTSTGKKKLQDTIQKDRATNKNSRYTQAKWVKSQIKVGEKYLSYEALYDEAGNLKKVRSSKEAIGAYLGTDIPGGIESVETSSLDKLLTRIYDLKAEALEDNSAKVNFTGKDIKNLGYEDRITKRILSNAHGKTVSSIWIFGSNVEVLYSDNSKQKFNVGGNINNPDYYQSKEYIESLNATLREHSDNRNRAAVDIAYEGSNLQTYYKTVAEQINSGQLTEEDGVTYKEDGTVWLGDRQVGTYKKEGKGKNEKKVVTGAGASTAMDNIYKDLGTLSASPKTQIALLKRIFPKAVEEGGRLFIYNKDGTRIELDTTKPIDKNTEFTLDNFKKAVQIKNSKGTWESVDTAATRAGGSIYIDKDGTVNTTSGGIFGSGTKTTVSSVIANAMEEASQGSKQIEDADLFDAFSEAIEDLNTSFLQSQAFQEQALSAEEKQLESELESRKIEIDQLITQKKMEAYLKDLSGLDVNDSDLPLELRQQAAANEYSRGLLNLTKSAKAGEKADWRNLMLKDDTGLERLVYYDKKDVVHNGDGTWKVKTNTGEVIEGTGNVFGTGATVSIGGTSYNVGGATNIHTENGKITATQPKTSKQTADGKSSQQSGSTGNG